MRPAGKTPASSKRARSRARQSADSKQEAGSCRGPRTLAGVGLDVEFVGHFQGAGVLQAVPGGHGHAGQEQVDVGAAVGAAQFHGLVVLQGEAGSSAGSRGLASRNIRSPTPTPAQGHAHQHGAVAVAPADAGGGFLVGHEAQEGGGHRVAEGREGLGAHQVAGDDLPWRCR